MDTTLLDLPADIIAHIVKNIGNYMQPIKRLSAISKQLATKVAFIKPCDLGLTEYIHDGVTHLFKIEQEMILCRSERQRLLVEYHKCVFTNNISGHISEIIRWLSTVLSNDVDTIDRNWFEISGASLPNIDYPLAINAIKFDPLFHWNDPTVYTADHIMCTMTIRLSRDDGPAVICGDRSQEWKKDGLYHREDGPAIIRCDGTEEYWSKGLRQHIKEQATLGYHIDSDIPEDIETDCLTMKEYMIKELSLYNNIYDIETNLQK